MLPAGCVCVILKCIWNATSGELCSAVLRLNYSCKLLQILCQIFAVLQCTCAWDCHSWFTYNKNDIAIATTEADEAITSSDFVKFMGIYKKRSQPGWFWSVLITSPHLILMSGYGHEQLHCAKYHPNIGSIICHINSWWQALMRRWSMLFVFCGGQ